MARNRPAHIVVHAGFHKTGTTHLQHLLRQNKTLLADQAQVVMRAQMKALCQSARGYSVSQSPLDLGLVHYEAATLADRLQGPIVLISSEDLAGHMPGRYGLSRYGATADIMNAMAGAFLAVHTGVRLSFFFTARAAEPWLRSCHAQHVRATRHLLDQGDYVAQMAEAAELDAVIKSVAIAVKPHRVAKATLEACTNDRLGTLGPMLELAQIDGSRLHATRPANRSLDAAVIDELLALNRSDLDDDALRTAKARLIERAQ